MDDKRKYFIFASPEIRALLADNEVDIVDLLQETGIQVERSFAEDPASDQLAGTKDVSTIILASAALGLSLTPLITRIINSLSHKKVVVQEMVLVPVEDSGGNPVRDAFGNPILHWVERTKIVESSQEPPEDTNLSIEGLGFKLTFDSKDKGSARE